MERTERLVVKIGSSTITDNGKGLDRVFMKDIAHQVAEIRSGGTEVAIVTSGAVVSGKLRIPILTEAIMDKQVAAMVGQSRLMAAWTDAFDAFGVEIGQALYTDLDLKGASSPLLRALRDIVVVINANDAVNDGEMKAFEVAADNDKLAGHVTELIEAKTFIILTDVAGILDEQGRRIPYVDRLEDIEGLIKRGHGGTGGMWSKALVAKSAAARGVRSVIANGREQDVLLRIMQQRGEVGTEFTDDASNWVALPTLKEVPLGREVK